MERLPIGEEISKLFIESLGEENKEELSSIVERLELLVTQFLHGDILDFKRILDSISSWDGNYKSQNWILSKLITPMVPILSDDQIDEIINGIILRSEVVDDILLLLKRGDVKKHIGKCLIKGIGIPKTIKKYCDRDDLVDECLAIPQYLQPHFSLVILPKDEDMEKMAPLIAEGANINNVDSNGHSFWFRVVKKWADSQRNGFNPWTTPMIITQLSRFISTITISDIIEISRYETINIPPYLDIDFNSYRDDKGRNLLQRLVDDCRPGSCFAVSGFVRRYSDWVKTLPNLEEISLQCERKRLLGIDLGEIMNR